jgi:hypothetical protein
MSYGKQLRKRFGWNIKVKIFIYINEENSILYNCFSYTNYLKVVGIEKLGGLGVCILIEKGTGPW